MENPFMQRNKFRKVAYKSTLQGKKIETSLRMIAEQNSNDQSLSFNKKPVKKYSIYFEELILKFSRRQFPPTKPSLTLKDRRYRYNPCK